MALSELFLTSIVFRGLFEASTVIASTSTESPDLSSANVFRRTVTSLVAPLTQVSNCFTSKYWLNNNIVTRSLTEVTSVAIAESSLAASLKMSLPIGEAAPRTSPGWNFLNGSFNCRYIC